jgi:epoxyqueuosine reductase
VVSSLETLIKEEARRLGFPLAGITTPEPPPHWPAYEKWLAMGRHASMQYLADENSRARRANPLLILPECQSILMLGIHYAPAQQSTDPTNGQVAAYAWGEDYHLVIPPRLRSLIAFIEAQVRHPVPNCYYTDTGPVLERDFAMRAGLGWIGKNTCLINPNNGSYFLLAEILLGIKLEPDLPFPTDHCGSCTRCIKACPTGCILPDRTLDANRCISYLTIENKTEIPEALRSRMDNWIFGCDICQMVCPWNKRFASDKYDPAFAPRSNVPQPDLAKEINLTPEEFNRKFKTNPIKRAKRRGYLRNVAVALGNTGHEEKLPTLENALNDEESLIREHAQWAIDKIR